MRKVNYGLVRSVGLDGTEGYSGMCLVLEDFKGFADHAAPGTTTRRGSEHCFDGWQMFRVRAGADVEMRMRIWWGPLKC